MNNDIYFERYYELYQMIHKAYYDIGILEEFEQYKELAKKNGWLISPMSLSVLEQFCELTKRDLVLTLSKLTDDSDSSGTLSIITFSRFVASLRKESNPDMSDLKNIHGALKPSRDTFLAHNDKKKKGLPIQMKDTFQYLETVRIALNSLCDEKIDDRVQLFTESDTSIFKAKVAIGLHQLLLSLSSSKINPS